MNILFYILSILFSFTKEPEYKQIFTGDLSGTSITCAVYGCKENHNKTWNGLPVAGSLTSPTK